MQLWSHVGRRIHHKFCIAFERLNVDAQHWLSVSDGSSSNVMDGGKLR